MSAPTNEVPGHSGRVSAAESPLFAWGGAVAGQTGRVFAAYGPVAAEYRRLSDAEDGLSERNCLVAAASNAVTVRKIRLIVRDRCADHCGRSGVRA